MDKDFYIDRSGLASYFEKDWSDKVLKSPAAKFKFKFPRFNPSSIYSDYHENFVSFIAETLERNRMRPETLLDVGSSLGRTFYEACGRVPSLKSACLVEPSRNLADGFLDIFERGDSNKFPIIRGNRSLDEVEFNPGDIRKACGRVIFSLLNKPLEDLEPSISADLLICSNVIDQCKGPRRFMDLLHKRVKPGGVLALSCSYQWNDKLVSPTEDPILDVKDLFPEGWLLLSETNIEFKLRKHERHWLVFLSHVVVYKRI